MIVRMLFGFVLAAGFSLLLTPWVIKLARFVGAIDQPGERKAHSHPMPRLGGVAVFLSCFISFGLVALFDRPLLSGSWIFSSEGGLFGLFCGVHRRLQGVRRHEPLRRRMAGCARS